MENQAKSRRTFLALAAAVSASVISRPSGAAQNTRSPEHGTLVDGMKIYLGIIPSQMVGENFKPGTPEYAMHGHPPAGAHSHHLMIAIFDAKSGQRIVNAEVTATLTPLGVSSETKKLAPFTVGGAMTYCNYFNMPFYGPYRIQLEIRRPGVAAPVKAELTFRHDRYN